MSNIEKRFETTGPINLKVEQLVGDVKLTVTDEPVTTVRLIPTAGPVRSSPSATPSRPGATTSSSRAEEGGLPRLGIFKGSVDVEVDLRRAALSTPARVRGHRGQGRLGDVQAATGSGDIAFDSSATPSSSRAPGTSASRSSVATPAPRPAWRRQRRSGQREAGPRLRQR